MSDKPEVKRGRGRPRKVEEPVKKPVEVKKVKEREIEQRKRAAPVPEKKATNGKPSNDAAEAVPAKRGRGRPPKVTKKEPKKEARGRPAAKKKPAPVQEENSSADEDDENGSQSDDNDSASNWIGKFNLRDWSFQINTTISISFSLPGFRCPENWMKKKWRIK